MSERAADLVVRGRRVVTPDGEIAASVVISRERIVAIEPHDLVIEAGSVLELADDEVLLPGLVDTHVHINDPGRTEWEGFTTATAAAAAGGVTTLIDMPLNSIPATCDVEALEIKRAVAAERCVIDVGFWGGAIPGNGVHLRPLHEAGVFGFKCFLLPSGVAEFPPLHDPVLLEAAMRNIAEFDGLLIVHAEDEHVIETATPAHGRSYASFVESRPPAAETAAIAGLIDLARRTGCRVHVLHLSSAESLPVIAAARADGVDLTVETCPHYLCFAADEIPDGATQYKCMPPIRDLANRDRLWQALRDGVIDYVVTDHSPCTPELKLLEQGDFAAAWGGIASLQVGLPAVWTEARRRGVPLVDVVRWMSQAPAARAGLLRKGKLAVGYDADFCVFAPEEEFVVDPARLRHRNPVTPYAGQRLTGVVRSTWSRGVRTTDQSSGRLLIRGVA